MYLKESDKAYAAGFFDGDGHIRIAKHSRRGSFMLQITVVQATEIPLPWFKNHFGGTVAYRTTNYRGGKKSLYTWQASSAVAERFLRAVLPYLKTKKDEAMLALGFRSTFRPQYGDRSRLPNELVARRAIMGKQLQQMRIDKRRNAGSV